MKRSIRRALLALALIPFAIISRRGFLKSMGWFRTVREGQSVDADGNPIPWWSYSFILFLQERLKPGFRVFEYGSGHSTLWIAKRVKEIISVETHPYWYKHVSAKAPPNATIHNVQYNGKDTDYCRLITPHASPKFDVIVIDDWDRSNCAKHVMDALTPEGVVIFDDAAYDNMRAGREVLAAQGFRRLDFYGEGPQHDGMHCTSVFYRPGNCLAI